MKTSTYSALQPLRICLIFGVLMLTACGDEAMEPTPTDDINAQGSMEPMGNQGVNIPAQPSTDPDSDPSPQTSIPVPEPMPQQPPMDDGEVTMTTPPDDLPPESDACGLDGTVAVKIVAEVTWPESLALEGGQGTFEIWFRAEMNDQGDQLVASGQVCSVEVPDFYTKPLAGGDTHGTVIPPEAWAGAGETELVIDLGGREAGSSLQMNATALFLGTELGDPMGPWPESSRRLNNVDHDGDGHPGVTSLAVTGPGYSNPRIAIINPDLRADRIFLGLRTIIGFDGALTGCDSAEGNANLVINQRAFGCLTPEGQACSRAQTDLLDGNMPQFEVASATFTLHAVEDGLSCAEIEGMEL